MYKNTTFPCWMPSTDYEVNRALKRYFPEYIIGKEGFSINPDLTVNYEGSINLKLANKNLKAHEGGYVIPIKFNRVLGDFKVTCNDLKSLEGCPEIIGNDFTLSSKIVSSLIGGPKIVGGTYHVNLPKLSSIVGICESAYSVSIISNSLTSLSGIHKYLTHVVKYLDIPPTIKSNLLGLMFFKKLPVFLTSNGYTDLPGDVKETFRIIKNHHETDNIDRILSCQEELISAGLKEYARL